MKLSEAILLRGIKKPQGRGWASIVSRNAPCALGGALQAIGQQPKKADEAYRAIGQNWPFVHEPAQCPCCGRNHREKVLDPTGGEYILAVIVFLNDTHRWTRNQIANWVATVEPPEPMPDEKAMSVEWKRAA